MHVSLFSLFIDAVDSLRFAERPYGSNGKHLSLSSLEKTGAVSSRQYMSVTPDRTDFRAFSVIGTDTVVQEAALELLPGGWFDPSFPEA